MRWGARGWFLLGLWLLAGAQAARADQEARLLEATPQRSGEAVVCRLRTTGLPTERQLQSMESGLVSAVDLELAVVDERDNLLTGRSLTLRLAFDLWEQFFSVSEGGREQRFEDLAGLRTYLENLSDLPVATVPELAGSGRYRLRVGLTVHAIAPDEQERVRDVVAGDGLPRREGRDTQEASVSLGRLIRFFYKGGGKEGDGLEARSGWFTVEGLDDATH